jgi:hypothetical protein
MPDANAPIAGTGLLADTYQIAGGDHQQVVREARVTAITSNVWPVVVVADTYHLPADTSRVMTLMVSQAFGRVYLRFDTQIVTPTSFHWFLDPDDRWEVPFHLVTLPIGFLGAAAGGSILTLLGTAA